LMLRIIAAMVSFSAAERFDGLGFGDGAASSEERANMPRMS